MLYTFFIPRVLNIIYLVSIPNMYSICIVSAEKPMKQFSHGSTSNFRNFNCKDNFVHLWHFTVNFCHLINNLKNEM